MEVARLKAILEADTRQAEADLNRAAGAVDNVGRTAGRQGSAAQTMGRAFSAVGATAGYAFAAGVESAAQFEDGLRTINTVAQVSDSELAEIGNGIQQIARDTGKSTEDLTAAYYDMVSAGIEPGVDAMNALSVSALTGIGALGSTASSADLLTTTLNAWGMETSESGRAMDVWAAAVDAGKTTVDEIGGSLARAAPLAAAMGVEQEELAAALAVMTARGTPTAQAFTQMQAAMTALQKPNERLLALQENLGVKFADIADEEGLAQAYEALAGEATGVESVLMDLAGVAEDDFPDALRAQQDALGLSNTEMEKFIAMAGADGAAQALNELAVATASGDEGIAGALGSVEAFQYMLQVTGDSADEFGAAYENMLGSAGTVAEQSAEKMKSPVEEAARMTQGLITFMQDVGGPFTSSVGPMLMTLNNLGPAFMGPLSPARLLGGGIGWLATNGIKPMLTGLGNSVIALGRFGLAALTQVGRVAAFGAGLLVQGVANVAKFAAALLVRGVTALGTFALTLLTGIGRIAAWGAALAIRAVASIGTFVAALAVQGVGALVAFSTTIFTTAIPAVMALVAPFLPIIAIIAVVVAVVGGLFLAWQNNFLGIRDIAATVWNAITGFVQGAIDMIVGAITAFLSFLGGIWDGVTEAASGVWQGVTGVIEGAVGAITGIIGGIVDVARGVWDTVSGIFGSITDAAGAVGNAVGGAVDFATGWIPSFAEGTMDTGAGGLALLHPHEAVLPQEVAAALRGWLGSGSGVGAPQQSVQQAAPQFTVNVYGGNTVTDQGATRELRRMVALS